MRKIQLLFLIIVYPFILNGQVPQGISYQAVIRNGSGAPIASQPIGLRITLEDASHIAYYAETQTTTSNAQGVISVTIGIGTPVGINSFTSIPWKNGDVFIKLEIDPAGGTSYTAMGDPTPLKSVPYALYAENVKEVVSNPNAAVDDPIFEVKNKDGLVVFGVYQGGVRVYVEDTQIKGAKGGFAVGGLTNQAKAGQAEYFRITPDSARIWVKEVPTVKGAKGGFAVGGLTNQGKATVSNQLIQLNPDNYFIGYESGINITTGLYNSFFGYQSGKSNTSGGYNVFSGYQSGMNNISGLFNVFSGNLSGLNNTYGSYNVFVGYQSGLSNIDGSHNVFLGHESGINNTTGWSNNFIGQGAGYTNTTGTNDIFIGNDAGRMNTMSSGNTFIGRNSGYYNTIGYGNTYLGHMSGEKITSGSNNLIAGVNAANNKTSGNNNVILGSDAGNSSADGSYNVFVGAGAGRNATGNYNVFIGNGAGYSETLSNKLYINNSSGSIPLIGGDFSTHKVNISNILNLTSVSSYPSSPNEGDIIRYKNGATNGLYIYTGSTWTSIVTW